MDNPKPSIGRIVHYFDGNIAVAAIIVHVDESGLVNLTLFLPDGGTAYRGRVSQFEEGKPQANTWNWPPRI